MSIPVQNLYYLLCYAWDRLEERDKVDVTDIGAGRVADLLARVLISGTSRLLRRGLDRGYEHRSETLATVRGRIDISTTMRRQLVPQAKVHCQYDELQYDVLHNRILKSTLRRLASVNDLDDNHRRRLLGLCRRMTDVTEISLSRQSFSRLQLHRNNSVYIFLMKVCELVLDSVLVEKQPGASRGRHRFQDFLRDENKMAKLFELFVLNFFKVEQSEFTASASQIEWDAKSVDLIHDADLKHLPRMITDITLRSPERTFVIDTKYYQHTLVASRPGATPKVHSGNLYQMYAYLANMESRDGPDATADGMLLYPDVTGEVDCRYRIKGHDVHVRTLNLAQPWESIHDDLLQILRTGAEQRVPV